MTHLSEGSLTHSLHCACLYRGKKLYWVLHTPSVSKLHLMVAKFQPGWWPTCNGAVLSRGLLSPEWDKNLDVSVPPLSKPIHCQLDPPAGEYLFVSMTIKKREDDEEKLSWSLEFSLTEPVMKRQNKQLLSHSPVSKKTTWQGILVGQIQTPLPVELKRFIWNSLDT